MRGLRTGAKIIFSAAEINDPLQSPRWERSPWHPAWTAERCVSYLLPLPHLLHSATQASCVPDSAPWRCQGLLRWQGRNWLPVQGVFSSRLFTACDLVFSNCTSITHMVRGTTSTNLPLPFFLICFSIHQLLLQAIPSSTFSQSNLLLAQTLLNQRALAYNLFLQGWTPKESTLG